MKRTAALLLGLLLCLTAVGREDPLVSLSYLEGDFLRSLEAAVSSRLDASDAAARAASGGRELTLKEGDVLSGPAGLAVTLLAGDVRLSGGTVVDATAGEEAPEGRLLLPGRRYIAAEQIDLVVSSPTAAALCEGGGSLSPSAAPDYYAIARALKEMGLFRGSGSGFGEGFDLHLAPSRGEGLVMFLRLLGEEEDALACGGSHPFTDVPDWLDRYVAWAYAKGYANGVSAVLFGSDRAISAAEYVEFLLRALGRSAAGEDDYASSLERGLACGALTQGEYDMLRNEEFLRAHVAYVSYYALDLPVGGGDRTLAQRLTETGALPEARLSAARAQVRSLRIEQAEPSADTCIG